jgi:hypothetical protein
MSAVIYLMDQLGMLDPIQLGITSVVIISILIYVLKRA